jgi:hypothetical protein
MFRESGNLASPIEWIGYQRHLQANQRASAQLRGNGNDPLQGAHPLAHAHQSKATGLEVAFVEPPPVILHRCRHSIPFVAYGHSNPTGVRMF